MASWNGKSRSNYVKMDPDKALLLSEIFPVRVIEHQNESGLYAMFSNSEFGDFPSTRTIRAPKLAALGADIEAFLPGVGKDALEDEDLEHDLEDGIELLELVHLAMIDEPDNILIWMEIGSEKDRYLTGMSIAIAPDGSILKRISLDDIYDPSWRRAEY